MFTLPEVGDWEGTNSWCKACQVCFLKVASRGAEHCQWSFQNKTCIKYGVGYVGQHRGSQHKEVSLTLASDSLPFWFKKQELCKAVKRKQSFYSWPIIQIFISGLFQSLEILQEKKSPKLAGKLTIRSSKCKSYHMEGLWRPLSELFTVGRTCLSLSSWSTPLVETAWEHGLLIRDREYAITIPWLSISF